MSKKYEVFLIKSHMGYPAGDTILVHRQAKTALITSGKGCDPKDAARYRARLKLDEDAERIPFSLAQGPSRDPRNRETKPAGPSETKPESPKQTSSATGVALAREALAATERGYLVRKSVCAELGLDTGGTDDLLSERLKDYVRENG